MAYDGWKGGQSQLPVAQQVALCAWLEVRFCRSTVKIRTYFTAQFDLRYSHSGCVKLLARLGFEYRKPKTLTRVADVAKQAEFIAMYQNMLNSLVNDAAAYFAPSRRFQANTCQAMDAVHPEYQNKPAFGWVKKGTKPTLKTTTGRARVTIPGALNLETFDTSFVAPITVDGVSAMQFLAKIEARNQNKLIIHVTWDNGAYHKGPDVRAFLSRKNCHIHLIQLPLMAKGECHLFVFLNPSLKDLLLLRETLELKLFLKIFLKILQLQLKKIICEILIFWLT